MNQRARLIINNFFYVFVMQAQNDRIYLMYVSEKNLIKKIIIFVLIITIAIVTGNYAIECYTMSSFS